MAASFKNCQQVIDSLEAGAHTATIPPDVQNKDWALQLVLFDALSCFFGGTSEPSSSRAS